MSLAIKGRLLSSFYRPIAVIRGGPSNGKYLVVSDREMVDGKTAIVLPQGVFELIPETREKIAQHIHIVGPSGCGKSSVCEEIASNASDKVVVISADEDDDPNLKSVDMRLKASPELCELEVSKLRNGLIIFDDVEGVPKDTQKALNVFKQALHERGRKFGLKTINVYHRAADGNNTKSSLNEMTHCVVFPRFCNKNTRYMLKTYACVPENLCDLLKEKPCWGRRVLIAVNDTPCYMVGERCATIIDSTLLEAICKFKHKKQISKLKEDM